MKPVLAAAVAMLGLGLAASAHAAAIYGNFSGIVDDGTYTSSPPVNTSFTPGQSISGSFVFDNSSDAFTSFEIGGYSTPGAPTIFSPPLAATGFAFVGEKAVDVTGAVTSLLQINFYYENMLPSTVDIAAFIQDPGAYSQDLTGGSPSYFSVFLANGGSPIQVDGLLTSYATPEPAAVLLMLPALAGFGLARRRVAT